MLRLSTSASPLPARLVVLRCHLSPKRLLLLLPLTSSACSTVLLKRPSLLGTRCGKLAIVSRRNWSFTRVLL